eukprot:c22455_g1_i1.p1 GENE.c22455_g1_i1~~c22455_g1_i1.p1  ORF type:complete len:128 (+),score=57.81 c22455_g1_i1:45-386(+)
MSIIVELREMLGLDGNEENADVHHLVSLLQESNWDVNSAARAFLGFKDSFYPSVTETQESTSNMSPETVNEDWDGITSPVKKLNVSTLKSPPFLLTKSSSSLSTASSCDWIVL